MSSCRMLVYFNNCPIFPWQYVTSHSDVFVRLLLTPGMIIGHFICDQELWVWYYPKWRDDASACRDDIGTHGDDISVCGDNVCTNSVKCCTHCEDVSSQDDDISTKHFMTIMIFSIIFRQFMLELWCFLLHSDGYIFPNTQGFVILPRNAAELCSFWS